MTPESLLTTLAALWHIDPLRWAVYMAVLLYVLYVYVMRYKRIRDRRDLRLREKIVAYPVALFAVVFDWFFNLTVGTVVFRERPYSWDELFTDRLQRTINRPSTYAGYRLWLARTLKPILNRHDPGHLK